MSQRKGDTPCFDCGDRQLGCHSSCERYAEYISKLKETRKKIWVDKSVDDLNFQAKMKTLKEKNWRKGYDR